MKNIVSAITLSLGLAASFAATSTHAAGTLAGTVIENTATVSFGSSAPISSNTTTLTVDEVININVTSLDSGNVDVNAGDISSVQAYQVTNLGNGEESFVFNTTTTGAFNPDATKIYYEPVIGGNGQFDNNSIETPYVPGTSLPLDPDQEYYIYIVSDIPAGAVIGETSTVTLDVVSQTPGIDGTAIGDVIAGAGTGGTDVIVATTGGTTTETTTYTVTAAPEATVTIVKSIVSATAVVNGITLNDKYIPGATVKYQVSVEVTAGTASDLVIIDSLPAEVTFVANTLMQRIGDTGAFSAVTPANGAYDAVDHKVSVDFGDRTVGIYQIQLDTLIK